MCSSSYELRLQLQISSLLGEALPLGQLLHQSHLHPSYPVRDALLLTCIERVRSDDRIDLRFESHSSPSAAASSFESFAA